jgi:hypothetical protein
MRKIVFVFLVLLMPMSIMAQTEHMSFMGISMDCKISKFKKQLVAKGLNYYSEYTKFIKPQDHMAFLGTFSGEDAKIFVFFDPQSKLVHEVKVVIEHETQEVGRRHYLTLKDNLKEKYKDYFIKETVDDGQDLLIIAIPNVMANKGMVVLSYSKEEKEKLYTVQYFDEINGKIRKKHIVDDL